MSEAQHAPIATQEPPEKPVITIDLAAVPDAPVIPGEKVATKPSFFLHCLNINQDLLQKLSITPIIAVELYRLLVSALLILFVPQDCGDGAVCTYSENMDPTSNLYRIGLGFNYSTLFVFLVLYVLEIYRENRLIKYLEVNKALAFDNDSVEVSLLKLPVQSKNKIYSIDYYYQKVGYLAIAMFIVNTIISGRVVYEFYLDNQTTTTFVTNVLFMITKITDIYQTVNTEKNIFYSSYLREKVQFNDVDDDYVEVSTDEEKNLEIETPEIIAGASV